MFIKGKGYILDYPVARAERVKEALSTRGACTTIPQIAKAATVDTDVVHELVRLGRVCRSGEGAYLFVESKA